MLSKPEAKFKQPLSKRLANVCISPLYESEKENESESDKDNGSREREAPVVDKFWKDGCYDLLVATGELNLCGGASVKFSGLKKEQIRFDETSVCVLQRVMSVTV